jgi:hypothetical protein
MIDVDKLEALAKAAADHGEKIGETSWYTESEFIVNMMMHPIDAELAEATTPDAILELCAEVRRLRESIRIQANAARAGMHAAKSHASHLYAEADRARAESSPDVLASERAMNALLTEENERMRTLLDHRPAVNAGLVEAYMTWTAQVYVSDHAAFSEETRQ